MLQRVAIDKQSLEGAADQYATSAPFAAKLGAARGSGQSLSPATRAPMERAFATDFDHVRVHADSRAATLAQSIDARAFTSGRDIFFGAGAYPPRNAEGHKLLAHELTHVLQQTGTTSAADSMPDNGAAIRRPRPAAGGSLGRTIQRGKIDKHTLGSDWGEMLNIMHSYGVMGDPAPVIQTENFHGNLSLLKAWRDFLAKNPKYKTFTDTLNAEIAKLSLAAGTRVVFPAAGNAAGAMAAAAGAGAGRLMAANMASHANTPGFAGKAGGILSTVAGYNFEMAKAAQGGGASYTAAGDYDTKDAGGAVATHQAKMVSSANPEQVSKQALASAHQLAGEHGESPAAGSTTVSEIGVDATKNHFPFESDPSKFTFEQFKTEMTKWRTSRKADAFKSVNFITFTFTPGARVLKDCLVASVTLDSKGKITNAKYKPLG